MSEEEVVGAFRAFVSGKVVPDAQLGLRSRPVPIKGTADQTDTAFEHRLNQQFRKITQENSSLLGGTVELVGLDDVRKALGSTWAEASAKVGELAEAEIRNNLSEYDFYKAYGTSSFLICFVGMDKADAERTAAQIAARIKEQLAVLFPSIAQEVQPQQFVGEVAADAIGSFDHENLVDQLVRNLVSLRKSHESAVSRFRSPRLKRSKLLFSPAWHAAKHVIAFNRCSLDFGHAESPTRLHSTGYPLSESRQLLAEFDFVTLSRAIRSMYTLLKLGRAVTLLIPVRYSTITGSKTGAMYQRLLETIRPDHRALLAIEIRDLPTSEDPRSIAEKIAEISPLVRWLALAIDINNPQPEEFAHPSIWAFSIDLAGWKSTDPSLRPTLVKLRNIAIDAGLNTIAHGANSVGLALAAVEAGITYVDGSAIHPATHEPRPPSPLHPVLSILPQNRASRYTM